MATESLGNQLEVGPLIGSGVLSYNTPVASARVEVGEEAYPTAIGNFSKYTTVVHPATGNLIQGWGWDKRTWSDDDNDNIVMTIPANYDPTVSGITETYFQSGYGSNRDLELIDIEFVSSSGINQIGFHHVWAPEINHGYYYDYYEEGYLFSDDSESRIATYSGVVTGLPYSTTSGFNAIDLSTRLKVGVPVEAIQFSWNSTDGKYDYAKRLRKRVAFTGTRDANLARQDTCNSTTGEIYWSLVDRTQDEFIVSFSGVNPRVIFNNQYVSQEGGAAGLAALESLGYADSSANQQFHTLYSPIDSSMSMEVWSYPTTASGQQWEVVEMGTTLSGYQVAVDYDLGILEFGSATVSGQQIPLGGHTIGARYWKSVRLEYEPEQSVDTIVATEASTNPLYRRSGRGFVYLSTRLEDPASIELTASLPIIQTDVYGPLYIGNAYAPVIATVKDSRGQELEDQVVTFNIKSTPAAGSFGADTETTSVTDEEGEAKVYYNPPRGINDIGEDVTASGWSVENSPVDPAYAGLGQITTLHTENILVEGDVNDVFLYEVHVDDPLMGYLDPSLDPNDAEIQLSGYYAQFFSEEGIYGPTGLDATGLGVDRNAVDWEETHRMCWELSRPSLFSPNTGSGRRRLVSVLSSTMLNPHTMAAPAVGPVQPIDVRSTGDNEYDVVFDTTSHAIDQPTASLGIAPSGTLYSYFLIAPTSVTLQAKVFNRRINQHILSNEISIKLNIPSYMNGLWVLDAINQSHIDEISSVLASGITASGQLVPLGFRLRSSRVTLAGALDGVTFLDVNPLTISGQAHQLSVSNIFS